MHRSTDAGDSLHGTLVLHHGTVKHFDSFQRSPAGIHLGTLDQAVHAATLKLARMPLAEFERLAEDDHGFRGIVLRCRVWIGRAMRVKDARTNQAWARLIRRGIKQGYDSLVYSNEWEGREEDESYVIFNPSRIEIIERV